ncbi:unnamed protein product, partial [Mesorhabditis spiculigera]
MTEVNSYPSQHHMFNWNLIDKMSPKMSPTAPMSTPDDPVIHNSPPSLRGLSQQGQQQLQQGGYGNTVSQSESRTPSCDSPGAEGSADERNRRSKTCRVCGDHATGYNFNVITCESCKAFFRRNALRPKVQEFKCPYSEDCEINPVSRRFCQKCRLRKCFTVGMKKEWILNEEQLRRRKNSRLNHTGSQKSMKCGSPTHSFGGVMSPPKPMTIVSPEQLQFATPQNRLEMTPPMISPSSTSYVVSPPGSLSGTPVSPPSTGILTPTTNAVNDYEPNLLLQQRLAQQRLSSLSMNTPSPVNMPTTVTSPMGMGTNTRMDPVRSNQITLSMEEYSQLLLAAKGNGDVQTPPASMDEPPAKRGSFGQGMMAKPYIAPMAPVTTMPMPVIQPGFPVPNEATPPMSSYQERMSNYFDQTIIDALNVDSPDGPSASGAMQPDGVGFTICTLTPMNETKCDLNRSLPRANYQLNIAELRELDMVRSAFSGMNEPIDHGKPMQTFMKNDKNPTDIMNIMDIAMRRIVKMSKKLPAFNEISQDGKFALLKSGMVEMLTVRGVRRYDDRSNSWSTPSLSTEYKVPLGMFDRLKEGVCELQKERFVSLYKFFHEDLRQNELALDLLMLMVLFTPRPTIKNPRDLQLIQRQHSDYAALLNRYLESIYGDDARSFNDQIPRIMEKLRLAAQNTAALFTGKVNKDDAEPLAKEFFCNDS